jgi:hypothetical protein
MPYFNQQSQTLKYNPSDLYQFEVLGFLMGTDQETLTDAGITVEALTGEAKRLQKPVYEALAQDVQLSPEMLSRNDHAERAQRLSRSILEALPVNFQPVFPSDTTELISHDKGI